MDASYITKPANDNSKLVCHKCKLPIPAGEEYTEFCGVWFHETCFNRYEHYYGLDKPLD